ncbi:hypothetical protein LFL96_23875 [Paraburkholderia sp. D15]|uniref:hypothetical protein n=1 Tax=Paraburkholderia sp. D15 TaxID=2880218 RepID=UPI002478CEFD|nr:hypothetical protein [Paraburkholderia sp. D15]WGS54077.1 hypothetical protein LFL96_23875 [Paraburkholderia sp. D15]
MGVSPGVGGRRWKYGQSGQSRISLHVPASARIGLNTPLNQARDVLFRTKIHRKQYKPIKFPAKIRPLLKNGNALPILREASPGSNALSSHFRTMETL